MQLILFFFILIFDFNEPGGPSSACFTGSTQISLYDATAVNPAILSRIEHPSLALVHTKPFTISTLNYNRLVMNLNRPNFGFAVSSLGQTGYYEYCFSLATAFAVNNHFSYGLILKGNYVNIGEYGSDFLPSLNLGILYLNSNYRVAVVLEDVNNPKSRQGDLIPATLRIGGALTPTNNFSFSGDFLKSTTYERMLAGVNFVMVPMISLRAGVATNPYLLSAGFGVSFKTLSFDYAFRFHTQLKETHIISLAWALKS